MSSPVASSRKRKAASPLEAGGGGKNSNSNKRGVPPPGGTSTRKSASDNNASPAHLPAPCLAAVLNFMWYTDVRKCMLAGKMMAVEAARHVETLNITKASELDAPSARRFGNVSTVNVLCLVSEIDEEDEIIELSNGTPCDRISLNVATRTVPFLASFPNLKRAFLGGLYCRSTSRHSVPLDETELGPYQYDIDGCVEPRECQSIFKALIQNLSGGFESRTLKQSLELDGILDSRQLECADYGTEEAERPCQCCRRVLSCFPLHLIMKAISLPGAFCVSTTDRILAMFARDGAEAALRSNAGSEMLLDCLSHVIPRTWMESENDAAFVKKMTEQGAKMNHGGLIMIMATRSTEYTFKDLVELIQSSSVLGAAARDTPRSSLLSKYPFKCENGGKTIFARQIFETLLAAGLDFNASDYIIVDPDEEPALKRIIHQE